jgi:S-adenosylmethionine decarboxylase
MHMPNRKPTTLPTGLRAGRHCLLDVYGCPRELLDSVADIDNLMRNAAAAAGAMVLGLLTHRFEPQGVSLVYLLAESHMSIHTWPEHGSATLDIYTCGEACDPAMACASVINALLPASYLLTQVDRGAPALPLPAHMHSTSSVDHATLSLEARDVPRHVESVMAGRNS